MTETKTGDPQTPDEAAGLPEAAQRALREAEERRAKATTKESLTREIGGRGGKDPARYGDWEVKGIAVDF